MTPARSSPSFACLIGLACAAVIGVKPALAEDSPYSLSIGQAITHDTNPLRLSDDRPPGPGLRRSDTIHTSSLLGRLDQPIGRQRLHGSAVVRALRHANNEVYDSTRYALHLGADWATVNHWSGVVNLDARRRERPDLRDRGNAVIATDNTESTRGYELRAALGGVTRLTIEAGVSHRSVGYSAPVSRFRDYQQDSATLGLRYQFSGALSGGLSLRHTQLDYPYLLTSSSDSRDRRERDELTLLATWQPSGASTVRARVATARTRHEQLTVRDFTAVTGGLEWQWTPAGRLQFLARLARDAGQDDTLSTSAFSRTTDTLGLRVTYQLGGKTTLNADVTGYRRTQQGSGGSVDGMVGIDNGHLLALGARWNPLRNIGLGCSLSHERRGANSSPAIQESYRASSFGCTGQMTFE